MRWLAVLALFAGCGDGSAFECSDDQQCVLAGTPGVCQPDGNCSYPDNTCPSGYRYPAAAGGECVPTDVATGTVMQTDTDTGADATSASSTNPATSASSASSSAGPGEESGPATTDVDTGVTSVDPTGGTQVCGPEPPEPVVIETAECDPIVETVEGELDGDGDVDVYRLSYESACKLYHALYVNSDDPMRACIYFECVDPLVECSDNAELAMMNDIPGCCVGPTPFPQPAAGTVQCNGGNINIHAVVDSGPPNTCAAYHFTYGEGPVPE